MIVREVRGYADAAGGRKRIVLGTRDGYGGLGC